MSDYDDAGEVMASGQALETVARWLGVEDVDAILGQEGLATEYEMQRPQGLGLGATYLPHSKAIALTTGVEQRLKRKLQQSAERQRKEGVALADGGEQRQQQAQRGGWGRNGSSGSAVPLHKQQKHHPKQQQQQQRRREADGGSESEDEEERKGASGKPARSKGLSRVDLLNAVAQLPKKRQKR